MVTFTQDAAEVAEKFGTRKKIEDLAARFDAKAKQHQAVSIVVWHGANLYLEVKDQRLQHPRNMRLCITIDGTTGEAKYAGQGQEYSFARKGWQSIAREVAGSEVRIYSDVDGNAPVDWRKDERGHDTNWHLRRSGENTPWFIVKSRFFGSSAGKYGVFGAGMDDGGGAKCFARVRTLKEAQARVLEIDPASAVDVTEITFGNSRWLIDDRVREKRGGGIGCPRRTGTITRLRSNNFCYVRWDDAEKPALHPLASLEVILAEFKAS